MDRITASADGADDTDEKAKAKPLDRGSTPYRDDNQQRKAKPLDRGYNPAAMTGRGCCLYIVRNIEEEKKKNRDQNGQMNIRKIAHASNVCSNASRLDTWIAAMTTNNDKQNLWIAANTLPR